MGINLDEAIDAELSETVINSFVREFHLETLKHPEIFIPLVRRMVINIMEEGYTLKDIEDLTDGEITSDNLLEILKK